MPINESGEYSEDEEIQLENQRNLEEDEDEMPDIEYAEVLLAYQFEGLDLEELLDAPGMFHPKTFES